MDISFAYQRRSNVNRVPNGLAISLAPNLRRDRVSYDGQLKDPLRFREAISALHDVVISDLRFQQRDKSAYEEYQNQETARLSALRRSASAAKRQEQKMELEAKVGVMPAGLEADFKRQRKHYWKARQQYSNYLWRSDPELWRRMMPCDPVITVAPDVLLFECFSADESSYGCLSVGRDAMSDERDIKLGTTNVDYSWALYEHFQQLRSYRNTRFNVDPSGFDVSTQEAESHREEKIELPNSWLRGFMQLQSAMSLPMRKVPVSREGLYNVLAFLKRHRAAKSPRAVRFELEPGKPVCIVLEPWEKKIELHSTPYDGLKTETIRVWGRDRLRVLARLLPIAENAHVFLLGNGLPSFWVTNLGDMQLTLGLSGWTTNDWTSGSALTQLKPPVEVSEVDLITIAGAFRTDPACTFKDLNHRINLESPVIAAGLNHLAHLGQVIHDLPAGVYRWRQVMPAPLTASQLGAPDPETMHAQRLLETIKFTVDRNEQSPSGLQVVTGHAGNRKVEMIIDQDGLMKRAKCGCSHHFKNGLRKGPCRHLQALRNFMQKSETQPQTLERWFNQFWN